MIPNGFYHQPPVGYAEPPIGYMQSQMPQQAGPAGSHYYVMEPQFAPPLQQQQYIAPQVNHAILHGTAMSSSGKSSDKPILRKPLDGYAIVEKIQIIPLGDRAPLPDQTFINGATTPGNFRLKIYGRTSSSRWEKLGELDYEESGTKELSVTFRDAVKEIEFAGDFMSLSFIVYGVEKHRSTAAETRASTPAQDRHAADANRHSSSSARGDKSRHSVDKRKQELDSDDERQRENDLKKRRKEEREQRLLTAIHQLQRSTELRVKTNISSNKSVPLSCLLSSQLFKYIGRLSNIKSSSYTLNDLLDDLQNSVRKNLSKSRLPEETVGKIAARVVLRLNCIAPQLRNSVDEAAVPSVGDGHHQELTQFCYLLLRYTSMPRVDVYGVGSVSLYNDLFRLAVYRLEAILSEDPAGCRLILSLKVVKWLVLAITDEACVMAVKQAAFDTLLQMLVQPIIMQQFLNDGFLNRVSKYVSTSDDAALAVDDVKKEGMESVVVSNPIIAAVGKELLMPYYAQLVRMCQLFILCQELNDYAETFDSTSDYAVQRNDVGIAARLLDAMSSTVQQLSRMELLSDNFGDGDASASVAVDIDGVTVDLSAARCLSNYGMLHSIAVVMRQVHAFVAETANPVGKIMKAVADAAAIKAPPTSSNAVHSNSIDYDTMGSGGGAVTATIGSSSGSVIYHDVLAESMRLFVHSVLLFTHQTACKQHHVDTLLLTLLFPHAQNKNNRTAVVNSNNYHCCTEIITCTTQLLADRRLFTSTVPQTAGGGDNVLHTDDIVVESHHQQIQSANSAVPKALVENIRYALNIFTLFDQLAQRLFPPPLPLGVQEDEQRDKADADNDNVIALEIGADLLRLSYDLRYHTCLMHTLAHPLIIGMFARYFGQAQYSTTPVMQQPLTSKPTNDKTTTPSASGAGAIDAASNAKSNVIPRPPPLTGSQGEASASSSTITTTTTTNTRRPPPPRSDSNASAGRNNLPAYSSPTASAPHSPPKQLFKLSDSWQQNPMTILLSDMLHRMLKYVTTYGVIVRYAQLLPSVEQVTHVGALKELAKMLMPYRDFTENVARTFRHGTQQQLELPQQFMRSTCMRMLGVLDRASQLDMIKMPRYSTAICVRLIADCVYAFQAIVPDISSAFEDLNAVTAQLDSVRIVLQCQGIESLCSAVRANCRYALDKTTTMSYERFESLTAIVAACLQVLKRVVMVVCRMTVSANDSGAVSADNNKPALPFGYINDIVEAALHAYMLCYYNDDENDVMRIAIGRDCMTIFAVLALLASYNINDVTADDDENAGLSAAKTDRQRHGFVALMQCVAERMDAGERGQLPVMQFMRNFFQLLYEAPKRLFAELSGFFGYNSNKFSLQVADDRLTQQQLERIDQFQRRIRDVVNEYGAETIEVCFGNLCSRIVYAAYSPKLPIAQGIHPEDSVVARKYKTACLFVCAIMLHSSPQLASALFSRLLRELVEAVDMQPRKINVSSAIWSLRQIAMLLCSSRNHNTLRVIVEDPVAGGISATTDSKDGTQQLFSFAPSDMQSMQKFHQFLSKLDQFLRTKALRLLQEQNDPASASGSNRASSNLTFASLNDVMQYLRSTSSSERTTADNGGAYESGAAVGDMEVPQQEVAENGLPAVDEADDVDLDDDNDTSQRHRGGSTEDAFESSPAGAASETKRH